MQDAKFGKPREGLQSPFPGSGPPPSGVGFGGPQGPPWLPVLPLDAPMLSSETSAGTEGRKPASMGAVERVTATESTDAFTQMTWSDFKKCAYNSLFLTVDPSGIVPPTVWNVEGGNRF